MHEGDQVYHLPECKNFVFVDILVNYSRLLYEQKSMSRSLFIKNSLKIFKRNKLSNAFYFYKVKSTLIEERYVWNN